MEAKKKSVFIIGHKNPDTDSICSAIALADIKNRTYQSQDYKPMRAGQINEETEYVLNRFGVEKPAYISNVGTQVKDMDIRKSPNIDKSFSIKKAWDMMKENSVVTLPIRDKEGILEGLVTIGDIAEIYMTRLNNRMLSDAKTQFRRIAETINGTILAGNDHAYFVKGKVLIGASDNDTMSQYIEEGDLIILGNREETHYHALEKNVSCMIICTSTHVSEDILKRAEEKQIVVISTELDTFNVSQVINKSIPVSYVMVKDNLITFNTEDYTDDIQEVMIKNKHRAFPVIDKKGKCIGTISRRNFLDMHKKKVILVDHNERGQAVDNIEKAEILEIIDHHKLGILETTKPIVFRNSPVGCTATILYEIYGEQRLEISPTIAGLLCSAIISDTLMFRSPTCTLRDKMAAGALALIADIDIEKLAKEMFAAGSNLKDKTTEEVFHQDYKRFMADGDFTFGVGQISSMDTDELYEIGHRLTPYIENECGRHGINVIYFMLTNILDKTTYLLYCGENSRELGIAAFGVEPDEKENVFILPGVVSRKKQLIPDLMEAAQQLNNDY